MTLESKAKTREEIMDMYPDWTVNTDEKWVPLEEAQKLEADLKRANMKLDSYVNTLEKGIIAQLVKMTNTATNLQIQIAEALKILNKEIYPETYKELVKRLREVLK